jgi:acyl-CoA synthetase (AMP-forming)/AMP-acid ligase II
MLPDTEIVATGSVRWTYADLETRVARVAHWLSAEGAGPGSTVATLQSFSPEFVALMYASLGIGAVVAPLNSRMRAEELRRVVEDLRPGFLIADPRYAQIVDEALDGTELRVAGYSSDDVTTVVDSDAGVRAVDPLELDDDAIAFVLHTSGTTGRPKPITLTHDGLTGALLRTVAPPDGEPRGATILSVPNHHVAGLAALLTCMFGGRRAELLPAFSSAGWLQIAGDRAVDHAFVVPTMLQRILADPGFDAAKLDSLQLLSYGAAPMPRPVILEALERFPAETEFVGSYGQTETGGTVCILGPADHALARSGDPAALARLSSIGRPLDGVELAIVDESGKRLDPGRRGEITVSIDGAEPRRTGDLGYIDTDGYVFLTSRADDLIIRGGENIDPIEIEEAILTHPAVAEAAVVGLPDETWGQVVAAFVIINDELTSTQDLATHVKGQLASFKTPSEWFTVESLPRGPLGKLLRRQLQAQAVTETQTAK